MSEQSTRIVSVSQGTRAETREIPRWILVVLIVILAVGAFLASGQDLSGVTNALRSGFDSLVAQVKLSGLFEQGSGLAAQEENVPAPDCWQDSHWLSTPQFFTVGAVVNVRSDPGTFGNDIGDTVANAAFVAVASETASDGQWYLGRWFVTGTEQRGFGWIRSDVAQLVSVASVPEWVPPRTVSETGRELNIEIVNIGDFYAVDTLQFGDVYIIEGRQTDYEEHHIWAIRGRDSDQENQESGALGPHNTTDTRNGIFCFMEGTAWLYDSDWNADELSHSEEAALTEMLANDKRHNMQENQTTPYDWPIFIHLVNGQPPVEFAPGTFIEGVPENNHCEFTEPKRLDDELNGIFDSESGWTESISIGSHGCGLLVFGQMDEDANLEMQFFAGAVDNLRYRLPFDAYIIPFEWSDQQVSQFAAGLIGQTQVDVTGIPGL